MERAHYLQERSLPELKDLIEKKIFTKNEVRQIVKRRSAFEAALVRRVARKSDFLRYIAYEMGLETLRRKRVQRLQLDGPPSISDYALVRKQFFLFERAVGKFKNDLGLWVQYIQVAKKEGAKSLASRICARALQLHPTAPSLFILASAHELEQFSPSAARTLLQRGLRLNSDSVDLWTEYLKMELMYIETLRRRWAVLGIDASAGKGKAKEDTSAELDNVDDESDESRRQVMDGAIVLAVMTAAVKAVPTIDLFQSFQSLINTFPVPAELRSILLDALHSHLAQYLPDSPAAVFLNATRGLSADLEGESFVDALKDANEALLKTLLSSDAPDGLRKGLGELYAAWVESNFDGIDESNIRAYLLLSIQNLISKLPSAALSPPVLLTTLKLASYPTSSSSSSEKARKLARKYTTSDKYHPSGRDARVWKARLELETSSADEGLLRLWEEARTSAAGSDTDILDLWLWAIPIPLSSTDATAQGLLPRRNEELVAFFDRLFVSSQATMSASLHDTIILRYLAITHPSLPATSSKPKSNLRAEDLRRLLNSGKIRPSSAFWSQVFALEASFLAIQNENNDSDSPSPSPSEISGVRAVLELIYHRWRSSSSDKWASSSSTAEGEVEAGLAYGEWLLAVAGDGAAASKVARSAFSSVDNDPEMKDRVENRWNEVLVKAQESQSGIAPTDADAEEEEDDGEVEIRMVLDQKLPV